jgi:protein TonB
MFTEHIWDPWASPSRRGWTTLFSFFVQAAGITMFLLLPLFYTGALPKLELIGCPILLPPARAQSNSVPQKNARPNSNYLNGILMAPPDIPSHIARPDDRGVTPPQTDLGIGVPFGTGTSNGNNGVIAELGNMIQPIVPKLPMPVARPARISAMMEGCLIHKVAPVYPPLARAARIQGAVELQAVISRDGRVERLQVLRGHPMLVRAALDAVQQWRYRPYILNGEAVEVETHVTVNFSLLGG